jgi:hypothetical protein
MEEMEESRKYKQLQQQQQLSTKNHIGNEIAKNKNYTDLNLYNATERLAQLNLHNKSNQKGGSQSTNDSLTNNQPKSNHFDNKNLSDYNKTISQINSNYPSTDSSNYNNDKSNQKIEYRKMLDEQVYFKHKF